MGVCGSPAALERLVPLVAAAAAGTPGDGMAILIWVSVFGPSWRWPQLHDGFHHRAPWLTCWSRDVVGNKKPGLLR